MTADLGDSLPPDLTEWRGGNSTRCRRLGRNALSNSAADSRETRSVTERAAFSLGKLLSVTSKVTSE